MKKYIILLIIPFLVSCGGGCIEIDRQYGKTRKLPPLPDENNQPQESQMLKNNILVIQIVANKKDVVLIETGAQDSGQGFPLELVKLKNFIKDFVDNNGKDVNLSERPDKAVISIKSSAKAHWETFIATQDAISAAYKEMRNTSSINKFGKEYEDLNEEENKEIKKIYPLKLTETVKEN